MTTKTENTATVPAVAEKRKGDQVSTTVPAEYFDGLTDHKWKARLSIQEIVREALDDYVVKHEIAVDGTAPVAKRGKRGQ